MKDIIFKIKTNFLNLFKSEKRIFTIQKVHNNYFILRHGETRYTSELVETVYPKSAQFNLGITGTGEKDIKKIASSLQNKNIDLIVSSDFLRTQMTAKIIAKELNLKINLDKRLRDVDLGIYKGQSKEKFWREVGKERMFQRGPAEGESWLDCLKRIESLIKDLEGKYKNKNILLVSHGDPLWLLEKGIALKTPIDKMLKERKIISPGELKKIEFKPKK
jgi:broad specificity phosphatase PhoE